ncbi:hypothetical protein K3495_g461 [Podosphaera aphanis]|nr:hypothetical protein K3495_g461 [Podosphaera aphanis]
MIHGENSISQAIQALESTPSLTVKAVGAAYAVPRSTLRDRRSGVAPPQLSQQEMQRLPPNQEEVLAEWIKILHHWEKIGEDTKVYQTESSSCIYYRAAD